MARTYLLFGESELRHLADKLEPVVLTWSSQWLHEVLFEIHCSHAVAPTKNDSDWWYAKPGNGWGIFLQNPAELTNGLALAMFEDFSESNGLGNTLSPLVNDCIQEAVIDLALGVIRALSSTATTRPLLISETPEHDHFLEGKGSIQVSLHSSSISILLLVPSPFSEASLRATTTPKSTAASTPLANPMEMIQRRTLTLTAMLGDAEIDIGTLQQITVGDIIRFDTPIDKPASLVANDGTLLCQGHLGSHANFKSLQLNR